MKYATPLAVASLPRLINKQTDMQAASPAMEAFRLRKVMGVGSDALKILGGLLMGLAGLSLLISMAEAVRQRLYDLVLMRCFGGRPGKMLSIVLLEGLFISAVGGIAGIVLAHIGSTMAASTLLGGQLSQATAINWPVYGLILGGVVLLGLVGSLLPSLRIYRLSLPTLLSSR